MELSKLTEALENAGKRIIAKAKTNLAAQNKNATGSLARSLKSTVTSSENNVQLNFFMQDYGPWVDQGRDGRAVKRRNTKSLFYQGGNSGSFPPPQPISKWISKKNIKPFGNTKVTPKGLTYMISRKIYEIGIAPSMFFTDAYNDEATVLARQLGEALSKDIVSSITKTITLGNGNNSST